MDSLRKVLLGLLSVIGDEKSRVHELQALNSKLAESVRIAGASVSTERDKLKDCLESTQDLQGKVGVLEAQSEKLRRTSRDLLSTNEKLAKESEDCFEDLESTRQGMKKKDELTKSVRKSHEMETAELQQQIQLLTEQREILRKNLEQEQKKSLQEKAAAPETLEKLIVVELFNQYVQLFQQLPDATSLLLRIIPASA